MPRPAPPALLAVLLVLALASACGGGGSGADDGGGDRAGDGGGSRAEDGAESDMERPTLRVVATIFPVADLVRRVGGGGVEVHVLLGPGASPATFEATPTVLRRLDGADLLVSVGGGLDAWTDELASAAPDAARLTLLEGLSLVADGHGEGTGNPHVWLDPIRTRDVLLPRIADALAAGLPPASEGPVRDRSAALADSLTALDRQIRERLRELPHRSFVASHPAWTYYAERYGLRQVGVVHEHPGQESSARGLAELVRRARAEGVPVVFAEPQIRIVGARTLAEELGVALLTLDPLGGAEVEGRDSYPALLRYNTGQFVRGLSAGGTAGGSDDGGR